MRYITKLILLLFITVLTCQLVASSKSTGNVPGEFINLFTATKEELLAIPLINEERAGKIIDQATFAMNNLGEYRDMWDKQKDKVMIFTKALVGEYLSTPEDDAAIVEFILKTSGIKFYTVDPAYWQTHKAQYKWQMESTKMVIAASGKGSLLIFLPQGGTILVDTGAGSSYETLLFIKQAFQSAGYSSPFLKNRIDWLILTQDGSNTSENLSAIRKKCKVKQIIVLSEQEQRKQSLYDLVSTAYGKEQTLISDVHPGDGLDLLQNSADVSMTVTGGGFLLEFDRIALSYNMSLFAGEEKKFNHVFSNSQLIKQSGSVLYTDGILTYMEGSTK